MSYNRLGADVGSGKAQAISVGSGSLTLADANRERDWRIYYDLAQLLIRRARALYQMNRLDKSWTKPFMRSIPPRSTCA